MNARKERALDLPPSPHGRASGACGGWSARPRRAAETASHRVASRRIAVNESPPDPSWGRCVRGEPRLGAGVTPVPPTLSTAQVAHCSHLCPWLGCAPAIPNAECQRLLRLSVPLPQLSVPLMRLSVPLVRLPGHERVGFQIPEIPNHGRVSRASVWSRLAASVRGRGRCHWTTHDIEQTGSGGGAPGRICALTCPCGADRHTCDRNAPIAAAEAGRRTRTHRAVHALFTRCLRGGAAFFRVPFRLCAALPLCAAVAAHTSAVPAAIL